jgi:hypothetical protein
MAILKTIGRVAPITQMTISLVGATATTNAAGRAATTIPTIARAAGATNTTTIAITPIARDVGAAGITMTTTTVAAIRWTIPPCG